MDQDKPIRFSPVRCPNCKGRGLVNWEKEICRSCNGSGVVVIDQHNGRLVVAGGSNENQDSLSEAVV